ncbi:hypothetical protein OB905_09840 [Halobacteria archaeon AArc-dxtr1]|nr:hypothetical protein [Halobacteria archaeon AArc-dxtr1]
MSDQRETFRHGLAAGGVAMLAALVLLAVLFAAPETLEGIAVAGLFALVGVTFLLAGTRNRLSVGPVAIPWNRLAALPLAVLGLFLTTSAVVSVLEISGPGVVWDLLLVPMAVFVVWLAAECWVGGKYMDRELFAAD